MLAPELSPTFELDDIAGDNRTAVIGSALTSAPLPKQPLFEIQAIGTWIQLYPATPISQRRDLKVV